MSARKANYPFRSTRRNQPKSSNKSARKSKAWMSLRDRVEGGRDVSTRLQFAWWKSPMMKEARMKKALLEK